MKKLISKVVTVATYKGEDSNSINVLTELHLYYLLTFTRILSFQ